MSPSQWRRFKTIPGLFYHLTCLIKFATVYLKAFLPLSSPILWLSIKDSWYGGLACSRQFNWLVICLKPRQDHNHARPGVPECLTSPHHDTLTVGSIRWPISATPGRRYTAAFTKVSWGWGKGGDNIMKGESRAWESWLGGHQTNQINKQKPFKATACDDDARF